MRQRARWRQYSRRFRSRECKFLDHSRRGQSGSAHGGLVIWDIAAPLDWDFSKYNNNETAIRRFLAERGASSVTVPYRENRAVIFDSDLFHETDSTAFKNGYTNRRMNITLLYGRRRTHEGLTANS
jgi:hypothetical protein